MGFTHPYSAFVNSKKNVLRTVALLILAVFAGLGTGCGGIGASGSVSPATFLLPGLGQVQPQPAFPAGGDQPEKPLIVALSSKSDR